MNNAQRIKNTRQRVMRGYRRYCAVIIALTMILSMGLPVFAAGDPLTVIDNLSNFIFGIIRAIGMILLGWGIVQVGLSFQSHDPSQRSNGFLTLAGGIVITFAKEILDLIIGTSASGGGGIVGGGGSGVVPL